MSVARGDVVLLNFPQARGKPAKRRPAVVVQPDYNNTRLTNSVFAMISSNVRLATSEPAQVLIDLTTSEGQQSGLSRNSAVKCENLSTLPITGVVRTIGSLPLQLMQQVDAALKSSLELP